MEQIKSFFSMIGEWFQKIISIITNSGFWKVIEDHFDGIVLLIWITLFLLLLEIFFMLKDIPAIPLAPAYLYYQKAGTNEKIRYRPIRKTLTRVGSNIFFKDIPILGFHTGFSFDIVSLDGAYWIYRKGYEPEKLSFDVQFREGDFNFCLVRYLS